MVPMQPQLLVGGMPNAGAAFVAPGGQFISASGIPVQMQLPPTQLLSQPPPTFRPGGMSGAEGNGHHGHSGMTSDQMDEERLKDKG